MRTSIFVFLLAIGLPSDLFAQTPLTLTPQQFESLRGFNTPAAAAKTLENAGRYKDAIALVEVVLFVDRKLDGETHTEVIDDLKWLARIQEKAGDFTAQKKTLEQVFAILTKVYGKDHWRTTDARLAIENAQLMARLTPGQMEKLVQALKWKNEVVDMYLDDKSAEAIPLAEKVVQVHKAILGERHPDYAESVHLLGMLYYSILRYSKTEPYSLEVVRIRKSVLGEKHPNTIHSVKNMGLVYFRQGRYAEAETYYTEAARLRKELKGELDLEYADDLSVLGILYHSMGHHAKAELIFHDVLRIFKGVLGEKNAEYAATLENLAYQYIAQGRFEEAETLCLTSLQIRKEVLGEEHLQYASGLNSLSNVYYYQGRYAESEPLLQKAVKIRKRELGENHPDYAVVLGNLSSVFQQRGEFAKAELLQREVLRVSKAVLGEMHPSYASDLHRLGYLCKYQRRFAEAEAYYLDALRIRKVVLGEKHPDYAQTINNLAVLYDVQGLYAKAEPLYREAIGIRQEHIEEMATVQTEADQLQNVAVARSYLDNYLALPNSDAAALYDSVFRWHGAVTARQMFTRATHRSDPALKSVILELQDAARQMNQLSQNPPKSMAKAELVRSLEILRERRGSLEKKLASQSTEFAALQRQRKISVADLQKSLAGNTALIDFFASDQGITFAFVVTNKSIVNIPLKTGDDVTEWVKAFTGELSLSRTRPVTNKDDVSSKLRERIWEPLEPHLKGIERVLICPDGALFRLPFAALPGADPKKYLLEELSIVIVPVPQLLPGLLAAEPKPIKQAHSLLAVGDVDFDGDPGAGKPPSKTEAAPIKRYGNGLNWSRLPQTKSEIETIETLFLKLPGGSVRKLMGGEASEAAIERAIVKHRFIHLATHGFFDPPKLVRNLALEQAAGGEKVRIPSVPPGLSSGIVCAGANKPNLNDSGILTALQIAEFDLGNVELAVLSACETGLGELSGGEGVLGLQRAFQIAGARSTISSLWAVPDHATSELMKRLYENRLEKGLSASESLREAQLWVLNNGEKVGAFAEAQRPGKRTPPQFWAAFILAGDWR